MDSPFSPVSNRSLEKLYQEHGLRIYRFCLCLVGNPTDAEDLAQEAFIAAIEALSRFKGRATVSTWLYRIALYRCRAWRSRMERRNLPLDDIFGTSNLSETAATIIDFERALETLPANLKEAFLLVKTEGFTCRETAICLEIPEGTLKYRVYEAMEKLQKALQTQTMEAQSVMTKTQKESKHAL